MRRIRESTLNKPVALMDSRLFSSFRSYFRADYMLGEVVINYTLDYSCNNDLCFTWYFIDCEVLAIDPGTNMLITGT